MPEDNLPIPMTLSLMDILRIGDGGDVSEYLSLSVTRQGQRTKIRITTTDAHPISYIATLSNATQADFAALQFAVQSDDL